MSLRVQLTLWSVLVMTVIVGVVTAVDLVQEVKHQFDSTLERADFYHRPRRGHLVSKQGQPESHRSQFQTLCGTIPTLPASC